MVAVIAPQLSCRVVQAQVEYHNMLHRLWTIVMSRYRFIGKELGLNRPKWERVTVIVVSDNLYLAQIIEILKDYQKERYGNILLFDAYLDVVQEALQKAFGEGIVFE